MATRAARRGVTLIELVVAMVVGGLVLGLVVVICLRQQRLYADVADAAALAGQLRDASSILPIDVRGAAPSAGDLRAGEARDTSLELRGTIASAVVCDTSRGNLILAPPESGVATFATVLTTVAVGDTAWLFTPGASGDDWLPHRVLASVNAAPGQCAAMAPRLDSAARGTARVAIGLEGVDDVGAAIGRPLRVTRPLRYSLYRAGDGAWYLGERDWNPANARFNTIQPVSGPFLPPAPSGGGLMFRYVDSLGVSLPTPVSDPRAVALIRVDLRGQSRNSERAFGAAGQALKHADSSTITLRLHNRI